MNDDHVEATQQDQQALVERLTAERNALGKAIGDAAIGAGLCRDDVPGLTGPQLLLLADDLRGTVITFRTVIEKARADMLAALSSLGPLSPPGEAMPPRQDGEAEVSMLRERAEKAEAALVQIGKDVAYERAVCDRNGRDDLHIKVIVKRLRALGVEVAEVAEVKL